MKDGIWLAALPAATVAIWASHARAHAVLTDPKPRDDAQPLGVKDSHKVGPCGGVAKGPGPTKGYTPGQTITVQWLETIEHQGCFQIALSSANEQNFTVLKQIDDPNTTPPATQTSPRTNSTTVTLPGNITSCTDCTLQLRQVMIGMPCPNDPQVPGVGDTYYSCADVWITADGGIPPMPDGGRDAAASGTDAGSSGIDASGFPDDGGDTPPASKDGGAGGGNRVNPPLPDTGDGCSTRASRGDPWLAVPGIAIMAGLAILRRRRNR
jgi:hypothetical protein